MKNKKPTMLQRIQLFCTLFVLGIREAVEPRVNFANIGDGTYENGKKSYVPDAVTTSRYLLYKIGSDADHVALAGAGDTPLGPSDDQADDTTTPIAINLLGATPGTLRVVSDGTPTNGGYVKAVANGRVGAAVTTDIVIGRAIIPTDSTNAAGDVITIIPIMPGKHPF